MNSIFTIGHSTRTLDDFVALLRIADVRMVADIRSAPSSRRCPQFDGDALSQALGRHQIGYSHLGALGGHRPKSRTVEPDTNAFWDNQSFHNYADYAMGEDFRAGLTALIDLGRHARTAMMCAEAVWWRCHRRIVADYLLLRNIPVVHILSPTAMKEAAMTPAARPCGSVLCYPR